LTIDADAVTVSWPSSLRYDPSDNRRLRDGNREPTAATRERDEAEQHDELPIRNLEFELDKKQSEKIRGGAGSRDTEANSEKIK
jgi:hypothetical protein